MKKKTETREYFELTVHGWDYRAMRRKLAMIFYSFFVSIMAGAGFAYFGHMVVAFSLMAFGFVGMFWYLYYETKTENEFYMKSGWDGVSHPLKVVPEYQTFLHP